MIVDDTHVILSEGELAALPEYSASVPSGTTIGKRWKANAHAYSANFCHACYAGSGTGKKCSKHDAPLWRIGEFVPIETVPPFETIPGQIGIRWRKVLEIVPGKAVVS